ncbi:MAG: hypothetical protein IT376_20095 [Polyangiaceae bacterium]|nr:hypothetical protein [Polyangiaceae bacterium]
MSQVPLTLPEPVEGDDDDVAWALRTAAVQWERGAPSDAMVWLRRAVDFAIAAGHAPRASALNGAAAELTERMLAAAAATPAPAPAPEAARDDDDDLIDAEPLPSEAPPPPVSFSEVPVAVDVVASQPPAPPASLPPMEVGDSELESAPPPRASFEPPVPPAPRADPSLEPAPPDTSAEGEPDLFDRALPSVAEELAPPPRRAAPPPPRSLSDSGDQLPPVLLGGASAPPSTTSSRPRPPPPRRSASSAALTAASSAPAQRERPALEARDALVPLAERPVERLAFELEDDAPEPVTSAPQPVELSQPSSRAPGPPRVGRLSPSAPPRPPSDAPPPHRSSIADLLAEVSGAPPAPAQPRVAPAPPLAAPSPPARAPAPPPAAAPPPPPAAAAPPAAAPPAPPVDDAPPPMDDAPPPAADAPLLGGVDLSTVVGLEDLPAEGHAALRAAARLESLGDGDEASQFSVALVTRGAVAVLPAVADLACATASCGEVVFSRGSLAEGISLRVVARGGPAEIAMWDDDALARATESCPWVADDLAAVADRFQALAGATMGPLGDRLDDTLFARVTGRCAPRVLGPGERLLAEGAEVTELLVVGVGRAELLSGDEVRDELGPGDLVFADRLMAHGTAPFGVRAGGGGLVVLTLPRKVAHELMVSVPPLLEILAG